MMSDGINPAQSDSVQADFNVETVNYVRSEPPPYTPWDQRNVIEAPVIHQTVIIQPQLKASPIFFHCPKCNETVLTKVEYKNSKKTHMLAGFICGFTLWCMLCCLATMPYIFPLFKKTRHYCPNCNLFLGQYSKF
ncbi:lipopolysaccharide-induced tumor necrosis factor-alpha factor homolog [Bombyx mandarina]|uniref:Lipopolysaccharide-induced tumor necrosis factor-alpha factor homolog n=1 Tax=Bombyx mandarina TaxID=7092 RepID=A0A6J2JYK8_BOMMA|nr:lipopolysaccharide-induced tumor necrosis factor-alpha factor homolog [Bombyx mandarina]